MTPRLRSDPIEAGEAAPDFSLPDQEGNEVSLRDLIADGPAVVYFYPKAFTTVCTAEACGFRDEHEAFVDTGARIAGISTDDVKTQKAFHTKYRLPYSVLSDVNGDVHRLFGLRTGAGLGKYGFVANDRVTFVIDADGIVRESFGGRLSARPHIDRSLELVKSLVAAAG